MTPFLIIRLPTVPVYSSRTVRCSIRSNAKQSRVFISVKGTLSFLTVGLNSIVFGISEETPGKNLFLREHLLERKIKIGRIGRKK